MWTRSVIVFLSVLLSSRPSNVPSRVLTYRIPAGTTSTLWTGVNVSGKLSLCFRSRDSKNQVKLWWIKQPFGRVEQLGEKSSQSEIDIPISVWQATIAAELKASVTSDTVVLVGENVAVSQSLNFSW